MPPVIKDIIGRTGSLDELVVKYLLYGDEADSDPDVDTVMAAIRATAPTTWDTDGETLLRDDNSIEINEQEEGIYTIDVPYVEAGSSKLEENQPDDQDIGTYRFRYNFTPPSGHIYNAISQEGYSPGFINNPVDVGTSINVVRDAGGQRVEGFNLTPPPTTFTLDFTLATSQFISQSYQDIVEEVAGTKNDAPFLGRPRGSLFLNRVTGSQGYGVKSVISFEFSFIRNKAAGEITIGAITIPDIKEGHDLLWVLFDDVEDGAGEQFGKLEVSAYIAKVWESSSFDALGL